MNLNAITGDCLHEVPKLGVQYQLVYLDPPFFTGARQQATTRDGSQTYSYDDNWASLESYLTYIRDRVAVIRDTLADNGSIIYHCDSRTSHHVRLMLERLFGVDRFRSEVIWTYKRWSNSKRGLIPAHQTLLWFSKGNEYIFTGQFQDYSPTTNVDQLLQLRSRDQRHKSVYAKDVAGGNKPAGVKPGVPLSDVWDIPYLNPKAKERVGYPTQKPVQLLSRIISVWSQQGDTILDPFCGSGTTLVAAQDLGRNAVGIDISPDATGLSLHRLDQPTITRSRVLEEGRDSYRREDASWRGHLGGLEVTPVQRHRSIDALLSQGYQGLPVLIRVQRDGECLTDLRRDLAKAVHKKQASLGFLVQTNGAPESDFITDGVDDRVRVVRSPATEITQILHSLEAPSR